MAKISLRAYNREISEMIDHGKTHEAIAHCQYILQTYPKHIETYRLLGKAYLESQRYADAADIFQRILSVLPDDFITHVGMSIVRGDEGNLDASIWHMERAFEIQPSNAAIQEELRHLYGKRDGIEPIKIRLTRGALVRMYARGNLFQQAIAEIKAALQETPQRPDLECLLAKMYFATNMKSEAANTCSNLLAKYPYCLDANRINVQLLVEAGRNSDAVTYQQRIIACDPYEAFITPAVPTAAEVPENMVEVELLDISAAEKSTLAQNLKTPSRSEFSKVDEKKPAFTADWLPAEPQDEIVLPQDEEEEQTKKLEPTETEILPDQADYEELPAWLTDIEPDQSASTSTLSPESASESKIAQGDQIPDWMKASGWELSSAESAETSGGFEPSAPVEEQAEEIEPGLIPDWLKSLAPAETLGIETSETIEKSIPSQNETPLPDSSAPTESIPEIPLPAEKQTATPSIQPSQEDQQNSAVEELPDWLKDIAANQASEAISPQPTEGVRPPLETAGTGEENSAVLPGIDIEQAQIKDDFNPNTFGLTGSLPAELPDWLKAAAAEDEKKKIAEESEEEQILGDTTPLHLDQNEENLSGQLTREIPTENSPEPTSPASAPGEEELSVWFNQLETKEPSAPLEAGNALSSDAIPDWLSEIEKINTEYSSTSGEDEGSTFDLSAELDLSDNQPPISKDTPEPAETSILPEAAENSAEEFPEWLRGLESIPEENSDQPAVTAESPANIEEQLIPEPSGEAKPTEIPDWLKPEEPVSSVDELQSLLEKPPEEGDELPDWLQKVANEEMEKSRTPTSSLPGNILMPSGEIQPGVDQSDLEKQNLPDFLKSLVEKPVENQTSLLDDSIFPVSESPTVGKLVESPESLNKTEPATLEESNREEIPTESLPTSASFESPEESSISEISLPVSIEEAQTSESVKLPETDRFANEAESILPPLVQTSFLHEHFESEDVILPPEEESPEAEEQKQPQPRSTYTSYTVEQFELDEAFNKGLTSLQAGDFVAAQPHLLLLVKEKKYLNEIISDLVSVEQKFDNQPDYWELLGDAYKYSLHLQSALDAYSKAEEML